MLNKLILSAAFAGAMSTAALATGSVALTDANKEQVRATLTAQGYEVAKIKTEDGLYEAYARKDGKRYEVFLDADFKVVRTKQDD